MKHKTQPYKTLSVLLFSLLTLVSACGGGGGSSKTPATSNITITGSASAPSGVIAQLRNRSFMYAISDFLLTSAGAAITGLEPVSGAQVELIKVDDAGNQVGPALVSTTTSITGGYELALPAGVNLAANLIVRISGTGVDLRAMVVEKTVDITPLSEFLLRKFIDSGTLLSTLTVSNVATLSGHAAEFDVAATSDLSTMLTALDTAIGPYIDDSIVAMNNTPGSAIPSPAIIIMVNLNWASTTLTIPKINTQLQDKLRIIMQVSPRSLMKVEIS